MTVPSLIPSAPRADTRRRWADERRARRVAQGLPLTPPADPSACAFGCGAICPHFTLPGRWACPDCRSRCACGATGPAPVSSMRFRCDTCRSRDADEARERAAEAAAEESARRAAVEAAAYTGDLAVMTLPPRFLDDHLSRHYGSPGAGDGRRAGAEPEMVVEVHRETRRSVRLGLSPAAAQDLAEDARHYAAADKDEFADCSGLICSARAVLRHLAAVGITPRRRSLPRY